MFKRNKGTRESDRTNSDPYCASKYTYAAKITEDNDCGKKFNLVFDGIDDWAFGGDDFQELKKKAPYYLAYIIQMHHHLQMKLPSQMPTSNLPNKYLTDKYFRVTVVFEKKQESDKANLADNGDIRNRCPHVFKNFNTDQIDSQQRSFKNTKRRESQANISIIGQKNRLKRNSNNRNQFLSSTPKRENTDETSQPIFNHKYNAGL